jgi:2-keto-4-pentenoate hydratase/2-oxohepta-3-ene-1,7-dioic acid hydratase in catechol pathway
MRFISYINERAPGWGVVDGDHVVSLMDLAPGMRQAIAGCLLPGSVADLPATSQRLKLDDVRLSVPIPDPPRIFCIGLNYVAHQAETRHTASEYPTIFVRFTSSLTGAEQPLFVPPESERFDFEGELAVIIGKPGRRIEPEKALTYVAGYSCFMDGSIRDFQMHASQYTPGKNFDQSGAFGPWLVTADELGDPNACLKLQTRLNGNVMQDATTDQMVFDIPALIAYISTFTRLQPGDVIATGTPGGVGFTREPPVFMRAGDVIEVEIDKIGVLRNTIGVEQ